MTIKRRYRKYERLATESLSEWSERGVQYIGNGYYQAFARSRIEPCRTTACRVRKSDAELYAADELDWDDLIARRISSMSDY